MAEQESITDRAAGPPERRSARRFELRWPIRLTGIEPAGTSFEDTGTVENISSRGALIYVARPLWPGCKLSVSIKVPFKRENWIQYAAEVIRVESTGDRTGIAIRFSGVKPDFLVA